MSEPEADDIAGLSYEAALAELDTLIHKLEGGSVPLDDAIAAYERGTRLARHCEALLDRTERRVSALVVGADGRMTEKPLEIETAAQPERAEQPAPTSSRGLFPDEPPARARSVPSVDPDDVPF
jgi:exodeoxyribonuclease VII small subunit